MKKVRDHYFQKAKREGFAARSVYKLEEIDRRKRLLRSGMTVLDLGASPGSWLQYAAEKVGRSGFALGVDLNPAQGGLPGQARFMEADVFELEPEALLAMLPGAVLPEGKARGFDVILSDMAPRTTGIPSADAARSAELVLRALELSAALLRPGGSLLAKAFQGARLPELRRAFREAFEQVSLEKPKASRAESVEVFLLGMGRKKRPG